MKPEKRLIDKEGKNMMQGRSETASLTGQLLTSGTCAPFTLWWGCDTCTFTNPYEPSIYTSFCYEDYKKIPTSTALALEKV